MSLHWTTPLELLVATILSAQCTDERVNRVTPALFARYPDAGGFADDAVMCAAPVVVDIGAAGSPGAFWARAGRDCVAQVVSTMTASRTKTVAGFMLDRLGSMPKGGEMVALGEWRLTVVDVDRNRISKVKVEQRPKTRRA